MKAQQGAEERGQLLRYRLHLLMKKSALLCLGALLDELLILDLGQSVKQPPISPSLPTGLIKATRHKTKHIHSSVLAICSSRVTQRVASQHTNRT